MNVALGMAQWVVGKALAPLTDGLLEDWEATKNLGLNIEALKMELVLVEATLKTASHKEIGGPAMEQLLQKLRDSAHSAEDLLDELDYFRIHDELHNTCDAADKHAKGGVNDFALHVRHTAKTFGKPACCARPRTRHRAPGNSSIVPNANQDDEVVSGCMPKLGKLLPCSSSPHVHDDDADKSNDRAAPQRKHVEESAILGFNRVDVSKRMKQFVEQLQHVRKEFTMILQSCNCRTVTNIAQSRPITTGRSIEPKLYGRDRIMDTIIYDITKGKYCEKDLTVLPIVGPGGIGKTSLIQHTYHNKEVRNHFQVVVWVCVSLSYNLNKLLEEIKECIPKVDGEKEGKPEELIEQRLKSKRFLLVLDDIWECNNWEDWERLLLPLKQSQEKGSIILVTTRFPAIAQIVKTTNLPIELEGLELQDFRELFQTFVFGDEQCRRDHDFLLKTGDKIMEKLKGSPLAAKTVGRLLKKDLSLRHWISVLESKEWERQTGINDIMPALKISYDYLPFHQQQCFSYAALFPEDHSYSSRQLIDLWIGLDILQPDGMNQTLEPIGLSTLNDLVTHGFFREVETNGRPGYVMHDLLHDLALKVASHECLSLHHSNVGSVEIESSIRHLSIIIGDVGDDNAAEKFRSELRKMKTRLKVEHLQTLMLFGGLDESFGHIFCDLFREANALRVIHLPNMRCPVESMLHNFSALVHLRYLCLGKNYYSELDLPFDISRFYHLRILDIESWHGNCVLPKDISNLAKLRHFIVPRDELHSDICNVGKLVLLEELKVFKVNKENEGYEPKQLEDLTQLREIGMYNLENIHTKEDAAAAKLIEKRYLERLTLNWDRDRVNIEPDLEAVVLENLQPPRYLQVLSIRGNGGPSCPTWLGDDFAVETLQSLHLSDVSWETFPSLGKAWDLRELVLNRIAIMEEFVIEQSFCRLTRLKFVSLGTFERWVQGAAHPFPLLQELIIMHCPKLLELPVSDHIVCPPDKNWNIDWFPKLQELEILNCPELLLVIPIPSTKSLCSVKIQEVKLLEKFEYSNSSNGILLNITGKDDLHSLDEVLVFNKETGLEKLTLEKCPPLELKHLLMLTSLKKLFVESSDAIVGPLGGPGDVELQLPVEHLVVKKLRGTSGKKLTGFLTHLPRLSKLEIEDCKTITQLAVRVDLQQATSSSAADSKVEQEKEEDGLLLFPPHLSYSLQELIIRRCPELVLVPSSAFLPHSSNNKTETRGGLPTDKNWDIDWFPKLQELEILDCPELLLVIPISGNKSLRSVKIRDVKLLEEFAYSNSSHGISLNIVGKDDLHSLDEVLVFNKETGLEKLTLTKCPPLELKHLLMLTSLKTLVIESSSALVGPLGGLGDVEWQLPVEQLMVYRLRGASGKELTQLLTHLPRLSKLIIEDCETITQLAVGLGLQETTSAAAAGSEVEQEKEEDGLLLLPPHLSDSLRELIIAYCPELVLVNPSTFLPLRDGHSNNKKETRRGGLQALRSLQNFEIWWGCPMFLSACLSISPSLHIFPSSLQSLTLWDLEGMGTLEPLSNLTSLTSLDLRRCGENLRCEGLGPLLTTGGQLSELTVCDSPRFFAGWDPNPRRVLQDEEGGKKQQLQLVPPPPSSSKLQELWTGDAAGFLAAPICSLLSSSLTKLTLYGTKEMERFSKEQEDALLLLASLQELEFQNFYKLQHLPAGLHKLTNLKKLEVDSCPAVRSLPKDDLPKSLQELDVRYCGNEELKQQCRGLVGTIPEISVDKYQ